MKASAQLIAALTTLMLSSGCGDTTSPAPVAAPTAPGWSTPPPSSSTTASADILDAGPAFELMRKEGFTADPPEVPATGPFRAIRGLCTGVPNGMCMSAFFFDGNRLVGTAGGPTFVIESQDGHQVVLSFPQYQRGNPNCCPTGGERKHTVTLANGQLIITPPIPADPNNLREQ